MPKKYQNFINGKWVNAKSGQEFENRNPANWDEIVGTFPKSGREDVNEAVKAARSAFEKWRLVPVPKRGDILKQSRGHPRCAERGSRKVDDERNGKGSRRNPGRCAGGN